MSPNQQDRFRTAPTASTHLQIDAAIPDDLAPCTWPDIGPRPPSSAGATGFRPCRLPARTERRPPDWLPGPPEVPFPSGRRVARRTQPACSGGSRTPTGRSPPRRAASKASEHSGQRRRSCKRRGPSRRSSCSRSSGSPRGAAPRPGIRRQAVSACGRPQDGGCAQITPLDPRARS
jgi:hypothetical protein